MSLGVIADDRAVIPLRALASPVRLRILSLLTGAPMSAAEVARELGIAHASASYHLRQLAGAGLLDVAGERAARGGRERRYRHDPASGTRLGGEGRELVDAALLTELRRRLDLVYEGERRSVADAELWVAPDVWADVRQSVMAAMDRLHAAARPPRAPGTTHVSATAVLFEMRPWSG